MEKNSFLLSAALVLIAQVPLLVKLYLDYRSKKDIFRQSLHERQINAFEEIASAMNELQSIQYSKVNLFCLGAKAGDEIFDSIQTSESKTWAKWMSLIKTKEIFLSVHLLENLCKYNALSTRTLGAGLGQDLSFVKTTEELELNWKEQVELYNVITNQMRIMMGVDTLSQETLQMIIKKGDEIPVIKLKMETDLLDSSLK
jgi:molybdopterin converting factor small subunit